MHHVIILVPDEENNDPWECQKRKTMENWSCEMRLKEFFFSHKRPMWLCSARSPYWNSGETHITEKLLFTVKFNSNFKSNLTECFKSWKYMKYKTDKVIER